MYIFVCLLVFGLAYLLNVLMITVGYHRGLAHGSVKLHPGLRRFVVSTGNWITGLDPKGWAVMHRMHHAYSDTPDDPHSPKNVGIVGIGMAQLRSYERVLRGLKREDPKYLAHAQGLDFDISWANRTRRWYLPYVLHAAIGLALAAAGLWLLGLAYFLGMMSHPVQGGMVNSFGHAVGGRNFDTDDDSRNNLIVAWLVFGEGLQNNHHRFPRSAKFSFRRWEPDLGFQACLWLESLGLLTIDAEQLLPDPPASVSLAAPGN